ncbi:hypothetical protein [Helicobacter sp. 13S00477-4]|uniref:hypothetical protein n=1 Tax=Helicobacter sp. 13S00477-4 TaxID=1905759 RepID=UPI000BA510CA|nr:hypothetical protein [Helicobacter sp. 13S00477-4]PAF52429.1 hypothetical protein BKH44_02585 [Helicobacter sp. 13S00477-4]
MNKNNFKVLEAKLDEQKVYIQQLESRLNAKSSEIIDNKNLLIKTHQQIKSLNEELNHLLDFILMLQEEKYLIRPNETPSLQKYISSTIITEDKDFLFGINIDKKFIQDKSIPTIKYYLYTSDCFITEEHQLQNLKISQKKDLSIIVKTFIEYIKFCFKSKKTSIKGLVEIIHTQSLFPQNHENVTLRFYGNKSIEKEVQNFIILYSKKN